jgi:hypothetical protein
MVMSPHTARLRDLSTYRPLDAENVLSYLRALGIVDRRLGGMPRQWRARECGDGNLNLIFIVQGPRAAGHFACAGLLMERSRCRSISELTALTRACE